MKKTPILHCLKKICFAAALITLGLGAHNLRAESPVDILPAINAEDHASMAKPSTKTHPILRLTPDKSELIRLNQSAGSIIVGNPAHISILAESSKTIVVIPKSPGATHFTILDKQGSILMQRHVIVASPKENYLRVRKVCTDEDKGCKNTNVYYCPDMCHEIGSEVVETNSQENQTTSEERNTAQNAPPPPSSVPPEDG